MIFDQLLLLDTAAAITSSRASTNMIDLGNARDMGIGNRSNLKLLCMVTTAFTSTGSGTLQVAYMGSTDASNWNTYAQSIAYAKTVLTAGARLLEIDIPRNGITDRYIAAYYTQGTAVFSAGAVTCGIVLDRQDQQYYPSGFTVAS